MRHTGFLFLLLFTHFSTAQTPMRDSLWGNWTNTKIQDTVRLESLDEMIWSVYINNKPDTAIYFAQIEYDFAVAHHQPKYMAYALNSIAISADNQGDYFKSIDYHKRCLEVKKAMNDDRAIAVTLNNIGKTYYSIGRLDLAIEYYFKALKIRERIDDKGGLATSLGNIGAVYQRQGNVVQAMNYQKRALLIYEQLKKKEGQARVMSNMALLYKELGDTLKAIDMQRKSLLLYQEIKDARGEAASLHGLGNSYLEIGKLNAADSCQQLSLKIRLEVQDSTRLCFSYLALGLIAKTKKNYTQAIEYGVQGLKIAEIVHALDLQRDIGTFLYTCYAETGNYKDALHTLEQVRKVEDVLKKQNLDQKIYEEQLKYNYDKKEISTKAETDKKLYLAHAQTDLEQNRRNNWILALSSAFLLIVGLLVFLIRNTRQKRIIAEQKTNLLKQKLLISQINPHFIFNSLNAIQNFIFSQDALKAGTSLSRFADLMRMILNFSREDFISIASEQKFLIEYIELQQLRFREKFTYEILIDESIDAEEFFIPPMLAQPFVENAIEHGLMHKVGNGHLLIRIRQEGQRLFYEVDDTGVGFDVAQERKQHLNKTHKSLATIITRERLEVLQKKNESVEIQIINKPQDQPGVFVRFELPYRDHAQVL